MKLRLGIQQRVMPSYRVPFMDALAHACESGLGVFAGQPRPVEMIETGAALQVAQRFEAANRHWLGGPFYLCSQGGFIPFLESFQPEALVVEANPRYLSTPAAVNWMHKRQRPVIAWGLGAPPGGLSLRRLRRWMRYEFLSQFDALIAYSHQGAAEYAALGFAKERVFVAPNAAVPRPTAPPPVRPNLKEGDQVSLLFVGRLQPRKRLDLLLRACAALPAGQQPGLVIAGDGSARPALETLAQQVYPSTRFVGALYNTDLEPFFRQADLFVLPGTGGLAVQQAMSFGLPVIVADGDGTQSELVSPKNGWLVKPGNLDDLLAALQAALSDPEHLRPMGAESYRLVSEEINLDKMVAGFLRAIESVI